MAGEIVSDEIEIAVRIGVIEGLEQREIAGGVARERERGCGLGQRLSIPDAERTIDPDFIRAALIVQRHFDAVAIDGPAWGWGKVARGYRSKFVDAEDRRLRGRCGVERDDPRPFGAKSGPLLFAQSRVCRQRTPSRRKMRRT